MQKTRPHLPYVAIFLLIILLQYGCSHSPERNTRGRPETTPTTLPPHVGFFAYVTGHAFNPTPPDRFGGAVTVKGKKKSKSIQWILPGARILDPVIFGNPSHPVGWEQSPFPLTGIPIALRQSSEGTYTVAGKAVPFSDWVVTSSGKFDMDITDITAIDGATTKDRIRFEAAFKSPDEKHNYRLVVRRPLPHGYAYPSFGGVVTNQLIHGITGIGTRLLPTEYAYAAFWGAGDFYRDGKLVNEDQIIHVMVVERVVDKHKRLLRDGQFEGEGRELHIVVPPYRVGGEGIEVSPLHSDYKPFDEIEKIVSENKNKIEDLPLYLQELASKRLDEEKGVVSKLKSGTEQTYLHLIFNDIKFRVVNW